MIRGLKLPGMLVLATALMASLAAEERSLGKTRLGVWGDTFVFGESRTGVRVTRVEAASPAMRLLILPSEFTGPSHYVIPYRDVITEVNGVRVTTIEGLSRELNRSPSHSQVRIYNRERGIEDRYFVVLPE